MLKLESLRENEMYIQADHLISAWRLDLVIIKKNQKAYRLVDFAVPVDHKEKIKENVKRDKYLVFSSELEKLWNMKVLPIVIGTLGMVYKVLEREQEQLEIRGRAETIQTAALLRSTRILRRVLETWRDLLSLTPQWKAISCNTIIVLQVDWRY